MPAAENQKTKKAFITGASSGIGLECVKILSQNGFAIVGTTTDMARGQERLETFLNPNDSELMELNFAQGSKTERALAEIFSRHQFDLVINNAGLGEIGSVEETPMDNVRSMMEINLLTPIQISKLAVTQFRRKKSGILINIGSIVSQIQFPFKAHYSASKAGLSAFTRSLAHEVKPLGIRVHVIEPGWVVSEFHRRLKPVFSEENNYKKWMLPFMDRGRDDHPKSYRAEQLAELILKVVESPKYPVRIFPGAQAKKLSFLSNILPEKLKDFIIQSYLAKKTKEPSEP